MISDAMRHYTRMLLGLCLVLPRLAVAQQGETGPAQAVVVGAYAQGAFIISHTPRVRHLVRAHPTGVELNFQRQTQGKQPWHAWHRYPRVGLALLYYDYHNATLGRSYGAGVYLSKPLWRTARQELNFRLGGGLGWFSQAFDQATNHKNTFVSSRLNALILARVEYDVALSDHLGLLAGLGLNHYSNGATTKPNLGINMPTLVLGLNMHNQRPFRPLDQLPAPEPADVGRLFLNLSSSLGYKQRNETDTRKYLVNSVTVAGGRRMNRKSNLLLGVEGFYDRSLQAELRDTADTSRPLPDVKKAGVFLGHELLFGRLAFVTHLGFYVYNPYKSNKFYYERIGLKYHLTDHLFGVLDLKVHRGAADVLEFKLGAKL
ncbi:acyloxyacyl hydrolase [Hymenobacter guriensis]|uniref:Acyloxyacyl hydrolase n=1 Tax=Hymenobacter guriensis TaxID=2793065 RepID=A0ABS0KZW5_9BACT|nr:acyloxyacyl hydrolase [Hymenobacter guriensis]MBG8553353.1 acyloxyacyl hydrolase [Hymenobacter guriensis]